MHDQLGSGHDAAPTLWGQSFCNLYRFRISLFKTSTSKLRLQALFACILLTYCMQPWWCWLHVTCEQCQCIAAHITLLRHQWKWRRCSCTAVLLHTPQKLQRCILYCASMDILWYLAMIRLVCIKNIVGLSCDARYTCSLGCSWTRLGT